MVEEVFCRGAVFEIIFEVCTEVSRLNVDDVDELTAGFIVDTGTGSLEEIEVGDKVDITSLILVCIIDLVVCCRSKWDVEDAMKVVVNWVVSGNKNVEGVVNEVVGFSEMFLCVSRVGRVDVVPFSKDVCGNVCGVREEMLVSFLSGLT